MSKKMHKNFEIIQNLDRAPTYGVAKEALFGIGELLKERGGGADAFWEYLAKIEFFGDEIFHTDSSRPEVSGC